MPRTEIVTIDSRPTYEQIYQWYLSKTKVILNEKRMAWGTVTEKRIEGTITSMLGHGHDNATIKVSGHPYGIDIKNIVSCTIETVIFSAYESKIILSKEDSEQFPDETKQLVSDNYSAYVSKNLLSQYSEYFRAMFQYDVRKIDLSATMSPQGLQQALSVFDKIHKRENVLARLSLNDALELIVNADLLCSQQLLDRAFEELDASMRSIESNHQLKWLQENMPDETHILIKNLLESSKKWNTRYLEWFPSSVLSENQIITKMPRELLHISLDDYELKMKCYALKLELLTQVQWFFNGINLCSEIVRWFHPSNRNHRQIYAHVVTDILMIRGIISAKKCEYNDSNLSMRDRLTCSVTQENVLLSLNENQLRHDIEEASKLISKITGYRCDHLQISEVPHGRIVEPLAKIGGIVVREYFGFDVSVIDYDLQILRLIDSQSMTLRTLTERCQSLDESKPLLDQIISPEEQYIALSRMERNRQSVTAGSSSCMLTKWVMNYDDNSPLPTSTEMHRLYVNHYNRILDSSPLKQANELKAEIEKLLENLACSKRRPADIHIAEAIQSLVEIYKKHEEWESEQFMQVTKSKVTELLHFIRNGDQLGIGKQKPM